MVTSRKIAGELLREGFQPRFLVGLACVCGALATFFPLVYCPCTGHEVWLGYVELGGALVWFVTAFIGAIIVPEQRTGYVLAFFAAPIALWFMLSLGVSH